MRVPPRPRSPRFTALLWSAVVASAALACAAKQSPSNAPSAMDAASPAEKIADSEQTEDPMADGEGAAGEEIEEGNGDDADGSDDLTRYEAMLYGEEQRLRDAGVRLAHLGDEATPAPEPFPGSPAKPSSKKQETTPAPKQTTRKPSGAGQSAAGKAGVTATDRCQVFCDLAASTCDLEQKICALAERHDDEPRYQQVCARAHDDCAAASKACTACSG